MAQSTSPSRLLGDFLRARREALRAQDLGLPPRSRRRTPGLRREEVAQLCGISPTWYTWIEQGRTAAISPATLAALAQGLHLTAPERAYLFEVASRVDPAGPAPEGHAGQELTALLRTIAAPAYVLDRHWNAIDWNAPAAALFRDWLGATRRMSAGQEPPNLLRYVFLHPRARRFLGDWEERARRLVAEFRADVPRMRDDPQRSALVEELSGASREFAAGWRAQQVLARDGGRRSFRAGRGGVQHFEQHILRVVRQPDLRLTILVPISSRPVKALSRQGRILPPR